MGGDNMSTSKSEYPEHEKLRTRHHDAFILGEFLDLIEQQHLFIARYHKHTPECLGLRAACLNLSDRHVHIDECYIESAVCGCSENYLYDDPLIPNKEQLIGMYLGIDPKKLSAEKDAMVEDLQDKARAA
jgi:hypothetical protein